VSDHKWIHLVEVECTRATSDSFGRVKDGYVTFLAQIQTMELSYSRDVTSNHQPAYWFQKDGEMLQLDVTDYSMWSCKDAPFIPDYAFEETSIHHVPSGTTVYSLPLDMDEVLESSSGDSAAPIIRYYHCLILLKADSNPNFYKRIALLLLRRSGPPFEYHERTAMMQRWFEGTERSLVTII